MRLLIVGTADDVDVTMGLRMLLEKKEVTMIVIPNAPQNETHDQIIVVSAEKNIPVVQTGTVEELIASKEQLDVIAIAWDDSDEAFETVIELSGGKNEVWDITDGLNIIDIETEALEEHLTHVLEEFTDALISVVYKMVIDKVNGDGKFKYRKPE
jgi:hypothetical protein